MPFAIFQNTSPTSPLSLFLSSILTISLAADPSLLSLYNSEDLFIHPSDYILHDPSQVITSPTAQLIVVTGQSQDDAYTCGLETWHRASSSAQWRPGQCIFTEKPPWVREQIEDHDGAYWAPELVDERTMFYSVADFSGQSPVTCIGLATATGALPDRMTWTDSGQPIACVNSEDFDQEVSAIDPTTLTAPDGSMFLITGGGIIHGTELDRNTMRPVEDEWFSEDSSSWVALARGPSEGGDWDWVEAAYAHYHSDWYYLFVNWGACCKGERSTYEIRIGRSREPLGPYESRDGEEMVDGQATLFLESDEYMIGPGHTGVYRDFEGDVVTFHYYDSRREGASWMAERRLLWEDGWPVAGELLNSFKL